MGRDKVAKKTKLNREQTYYLGGFKFGYTVQIVDSGGWLIRYTYFAGPLSSGTHEVLYTWNGRSWAGRAKGSRQAMGVQGAVADQAFAIPL